MNVNTTMYPLVIHEVTVGGAVVQSTTRLDRAQRTATTMQRTSRLVVLLDGMVPPLKTIELLDEFRLQSKEHEAAIWGTWLRKK